MSECKGRELTKREQHKDFGGDIEWRKYNIYSGKRYTDDPYLYQDDEEIRERYEDIEWEEKMKKKYGQASK